MKKIAYILGAVVLATGSVTAAAAFADAGTVSSLQGSIVSQAKATGSQDAGKSSSQIESDVAAAVTALIQQAVQAGDSNADIQAAINNAMGDPTLTQPEAAGIQAVNAELASLESQKPGGFAGTGGGAAPAVAPPAPPPPALAGTGYTGS